MKSADFFLILWKIHFFIVLKMTQNEEDSHQCRNVARIIFLGGLKADFKENMHELKKRGYFNNFWLGWAPKKNSLATPLHPWWDHLFLKIKRTSCYSSCKNVTLRWPWFEKYRNGKSYTGVLKKSIDSQLSNKLSHTIHPGTILQYHTHMLHSSEWVV